MALDLLQVSGNLAGPAKFAAVDAAMIQLEGIKTVIRVGVTKRFSPSVSILLSFHSQLYFYQM
jgi:hypothetical protein